MAKSNHTKPRKKGGALKILLVVLVLLVLAAGAALLLAKREIDGSGEQEEAVTVEIAQGSGVSTIAKKLQEAGVIHFPQLFRWYVGREGAAAKLQYGEERRNDLTARAAAAEQRAEFLHAAHQQLLEHLRGLLCHGIRL